jgi:putative Holliday junction resolvase
VPASARDNALVFDFGERRIGIATASRPAGTAAALNTLRARGGAPDWPELDALVREWQPEVLVIGLPLNADGSESSMTAHARAFAVMLGQRYGLPTETLDERFTSTEAESLLLERRRSGLMRRRVRDKDIDSVAAQLIAESWLRG